MGKRTIRLQAKEQEKLQKYEKFLQEQRAKKKQHQGRKSKKVEAVDLLKQAGLPFTANQADATYVRDPLLWECDSYNKQRQLHSFIRHLYCKYPVPRFLFKAFESDPRVSTNVPTLKEWLRIVGGGYSLRKATKGIFTAQEVHQFLKAPSETPSDAAWYAKCAAAGWEPKFIHAFLQKAPGFLFFENATTNDYWQRIILFFTRYIKEIDVSTFNELLDFLRIQPTSFSFQGRTLTSLIRLSNEWHLHSKADGKTVGKTWIAMPIADWTWYDKQEKIEWEVKQLTTGKQLAYESKVQQHCVWSYTYACQRGSARIFTLHSTDAVGDVRKHVTIEVDPTAMWIRQVRGKLNRRATPTEQRVVFHWAQDNGLRGAGIR